MSFLFCHREDLMQPSILSLLPPVLVLILGIATHRVLFSLLCGIVAASALATNFSPVMTLKMAFMRLYETLDISALLSWERFTASNTLLIFFFLAMLGIISFLLEYCGGATAYADHVEKRITTTRKAEAATMMLSLTLFIDDYFSTLTTGSIMQPLTDKLQVPRAKLAYLVDSMAAPVAIIIPISSWVAAVTGQLDKAGFSSIKAEATSFLGDPFFVYLSTIPFIMYSFITIAVASFIVWRRISFGGMHHHEEVAQSNGNLFGGRDLKKKKAQRSSTATHSTLVDFLVPVIAFIGGVFVSLLYTGSYSVFGGVNGFLEALRNTDSSQSLALGSFIAVLISTTYLIARKKLKVARLGFITYEGVGLMTSTMQILLLSWTLGGMMSSDLHTGAYLADTLIGALPIALLPLMLFIASSITSFAMGSSWGTLAIIIPITTPIILSVAGTPPPLVAANFPLLFPALGAVLSGAVWGDHVSPLSDTTIMSSTSSGAHHLDHVATQITYTIPAFVGACVSFTLAGLLIDYGMFANIGISLGAGIASSWALLLTLNKGFPKKKDSIGG